MIGWIGPALLLALFAAASLSSQVLVPPDAAVAAQVEELQAPLLAPPTERGRRVPATLRSTPLPRATARPRSVGDGGLPAPRAPTC